MSILALDLGKFNTTCCGFVSQTRETCIRAAATRRESLANVLKLNKVDVVVMESCGPSGWISGARYKNAATLKQREFRARMRLVERLELPLSKPSAAIRARLRR